MRKTLLALTLILALSLADRDPRCDSSPTYDAAVRYNQDDVVYWNGRVWRAFQTQTNRDPNRWTDSWEPLALCSDCEVQYNQQYYFQGGWIMVYTDGNLYRAKWAAVANENPDTRPNQWELVDDIVCPVYGCTDPAAQNYDENATEDDGSCIFLGCTDNTALNFDPQANQDDGSCVYSIPGCTNQYATNYNSEATVDDGSCEYDCSDYPTWDSTTRYEMNDIVQWNGHFWRAYIPNRNKDPNARVDVWGELAQCGVCEALYNPAYYFKGGWIANLGGQLWQAKWWAHPRQEPGVHFLWIEAEGSEACPNTFGCTNQAADNYDSNATVDDGSCVISGCTDSNATNYNADANQDDGSCAYAGQVLSECGGHQSWDSTVRYAMNDLVYWNGRIWRSYFHNNRNNNPNRDTSSWEPKEECGGECAVVYNIQYYFRGGQTVNKDGVVYQATEWSHPGRQYVPGVNTRVWRDTGRTCVAAPPQGSCPTDAWDANTEYSSGDIVEHNGINWEHRAWAPTTGSVPGQTIWGVWAFDSWCDAEPNCCSGNVDDWQGATHYFPGMCARLPNGNVYKATKVSFWMNPRWNGQAWRRETC